MNVVAVFGGGGAKAAAQIGAGRALAESGLEPREYIGTSLGGVVAACFASGMAPDTIMAKISGLTRDEIAIPRRFLAVRGLFVRSLLRPRPLREAIEGLIDARTFDELTFPLTVTAVDLETSELVLFGRRGRNVGLVDALMATTALPLYYPPVRIGGREYLDGGLRAVLPLEVAAGIEADVVVAVNVGPGSDEAPGEPPDDIPALVRLHDVGTGALMAENIQGHLARWRADRGRPPLIYIRPELHREATFKVESAARFAEAGYAAAMAAIAAWRG